MLTVQDVESWNRGLDAVAAELLEQVGCDGPPVDMFKLAKKLRIAVAFDGAQRARGRHKKLAGRSVVLLKPDERPERLQWAAAHELGEVFAYRVFERLGLAEEDLPEAAREMAANLLAERLLLPWHWFVADARRVQGDLLELKGVYCTASHELIAWRLLDLPEPSIVSVFDQGCMVRRRAGNGGRPPRLDEPEKECWNSVHRENRTIEIHSNGIVVRGWPIHEAGWKREILRTMCEDA